MLDQLGFMLQKPACDSFYCELCRFGKQGGIVYGVARHLETLDQLVTRMLWEPTQTFKGKAAAHLASAEGEQALRP